MPGNYREGFSTDAILLRKIEYSDHDYIITFLTRSRGKVAVMAKNAKKSVKRFSGALDLFSLNRIQCTFPKKNKNGMIILSHTEIENGFVNIRYDLFRMSYASYWCELVYLWLEEGQVQTPLFELLQFSLDMLNRSSIGPGVLSLLFQIHFMSISGFSPDIEGCETCKTHLDRMDQKAIWFDFREGRIICNQCRGHESLRAVADDPGHFCPGRQGMFVSKGTLKQLFWMNNTPMERADRIRFSPFALEEGQALMESFIPFHIGRQMKSLKFLNRLRQEK